MRAKAPRTIIPNEPMGPAAAAPAVLEDVAAVAVAVAVAVPVPVAVPVLEVVDTLPVVVDVDVRVLVLPLDVEEEEHVSPPSTASQNASTAGLTTSSHIVSPHAASTQFSALSRMVC